MQRINTTAVSHKELHSWGETEPHCSKNQRRTKRFNENPRPKPFLPRDWHQRAEHNLTSSPSGLPSDFMELFGLAPPRVLFFPGLLPGKAEDLLSPAFCSALLQPGFPLSVLLVPD